MTENDLCRELADALFLRCNDDDSWSQTAREKLLPLIRSYANGLVAAAVEACKQACIINGDSCGDSHTDCHGSDANCMSLVTPESAAKELEWREKIAAGKARHTMNQKLGEYLGEDANTKSTFQMLDDAIGRIKAEARLKEHGLDCPYCRCCDGCRKLCPRRGALEAAKEK